VIKRDVWDKLKISDPRGLERSKLEVPKGKTSLAEGIWGERKDGSRGEEHFPLVMNFVFLD